ncbi:MAG: hypothetical protein ACREQ5_37005 [Candidatus Dormibacteria bacterium]
MATLGFAAPLTALCACPGGAPGLSTPDSLSATAESASRSRQNPSSDRCPDPHSCREAHKWAKVSHPKKPKRWIVERYFGRFNKSRNDRWVFGDRRSGAYLVKHAWTGIIRHQMVKAGASPDDPALTAYWAARRRRAAPPPLDNLALRLLRGQQGRCPLCGELLLAADHPPQTPVEWEQWVRSTGKALTKRSVAYQQRDGSADPGSTVRLVHARCHRQPEHRAATRPAPSSRTPATPPGLA